MKKSLVALSVFLLVPSAAMAQEEEKTYIEGEDNKTITVSGFFETWTLGNGQWDELIQTIEDQFDIEIEDIEIQQPEDEDEDQAQSDKDKPEADEEQPEQDEGSNGEEGKEEDDQDPEQDEGSDEGQDNDENIDEGSEFEQEVVRLTNEEREAQGLEPLEIHEELAEVATVKSEDMRDNDYFSHDSPVHGSPFDMISAHGIDYTGAGENIAAGQATPEQVVQGWMESDGHRANIMNSDFTHIGIGHAEGGSYGDYWTQMFLTE
ncbi:CAP domain-containing protein [Natribacillus halophilus]|uniref:Uncharacterized protein, YkwD family n=1 Tax=Natribacillus halophilus TaxID=549003 RepID=A0A1G8QI74_9BACI|nr:uncharacterized protein, YkwD family [Natribacillus halophilus]